MTQAQFTCPNCHVTSVAPKIQVDKEKVVRKRKIMGIELTGDAFEDSQILSMKENALRSDVRYLLCPHCKHKHYFS